MRNLFFCFFFITVLFGQPIKAAGNNSSFSATTVAPKDPKEISAGIFMAEFITDKGEKVYIKMECLTEANVAHWDQYVKATIHIAGKYDREVGPHEEWIEERDRQYGTIDWLYDWIAVSHGQVPDFNEDFKNVTGFNPQDYLEFMNLLIKAKKRNLISQSYGGSRGIRIVVNGEKNYIVYATTNPNFSITNIPLIDRQSLNLKFHLDNYKDIIMCVGCSFDNDKAVPLYFNNIQSTEIIENRGIFRNPYWVLNDGYKGISMFLHILSGVVANKFFNVKILKVRPLPAMQFILAQHLKSEEGIFIRQGKKYAINDTLEFARNKREGTSQDQEDIGTDYIYTKSLMDAYYLTKESSTFN